MAHCLIGLGCNEGDRLAQLQAALELLGQADGIAVLRVSRWVQTMPAGGPAGQGPFVNGAALLQTSLAPLELLAQLKQIERALGRQASERWAARVLDLDLLLYDDHVMRSAALTLPHPRFSVRWFALAPAAEIATDWVLPPAGWTLAQLLHHLETAPQYVAICGVPQSPTRELARQVAADQSALLLSHPRESHVPADLSSELKLIDERVSEVSGHLATMSSRSSWLISDFWIPESLAYARENEAARVSHQLHAAPYDAVVPKMVVLLQPVPAADEQHVSERLEQLVDSWRTGPRLRLDAREHEWNRQEVAAAMAATQAGERCA